MPNEYKSGDFVIRKCCPTPALPEGYATKVRLTEGNLVQVKDQNGYICWEDYRHFDLYKRYEFEPNFVPSSFIDPASMFMCGPHSTVQEFNNLFDNTKQNMSNVKESIKTEKQKLYEEYIFDEEGGLDFSSEAMQAFFFELAEKGDALYEFVKAFDKKKKAEEKKNLKVKVASY